MDLNRITLLDDEALLHALDQLVVVDRRVTADLLAHIAEVDERGLFRGAACSSMHVYCVERLRFSASAAYKRIRVARAARRFPRLLREVAEGRLHLSAICSLAAHLTSENLDELVAFATHRSRDEIESWLALRFAAAAPEASRANTSPVAWSCESRAEGQGQEGPSLLGPNRRGSRSPTGRKVQINRPRGLLICNFLRRLGRGVPAPDSSSSSRSTRPLTRFCARCRTCSGTRFRPGTWLQSSNELSRHCERSSCAEKRVEWIAPGLRRPSGQMRRAA